MREVSQHSLRIQKVLEDANLKLGSVLSDVLGKSGRAMLDAIVAGETDPARLAALAQDAARNKTAALHEALRGRITEHHRMMLKLHLQVVDALQRTLAELDTAVGKALAPIRQRARLLTTMPGVSDLTASVLVAEIGVDMTRFPTAGHLVSWAGLCPRSDESAGKRRSTRVRKSGTWIKTTLVTAAWAAVRVKTSYLRAQFLRIKARRGAKKAIPRRRRLHAHRCLPHAARWHRVQRPGQRSLRPPRQVQDHSTPAQTAPRPRLRCSNVGACDVRAWSA